MFNSAEILSVKRRARYVRDKIALQKDIKVTKKLKQCAIEENEVNSTVIVSVPPRILVKKTLKSSNSRFINDLRCWSVKNNVANLHLSSLLKVLRTKLPFLPKNAHSLKKCPKKSVIRRVYPGPYVHFGLNEILKNFCTKNVK